MFSLLTSRGLKPQLHQMDNEASSLLKQHMTKKSVEFQLTPAHMHRTNAAERAIRMFKNHFVAILAGAHADFPIHLWCRLLP